MHDDLAAGTLRLEMANSFDRVLERDDAIGDGTKVPFVNELGDRLEVCAARPHHDESGALTADQRP